MTTDRVSNDGGMVARGVSRRRMSPPSRGTLVRRVMGRWLGRSDSL